MGRIKGGRNKSWDPNEKLRIISRYLKQEGSLSEIARQESISPGMLSNWIKRYNEQGFEGLEKKPGSGNKFGGLHHKKNKTQIEVLEYENFKLRMENEMLKKGLNPERVVNLAKRKKD